MKSKIKKTEILYKELDETVKNIIKENNQIKEELKNKLNEKNKKKEEKNRNIELNKNKEEKKINIIDEKEEKKAGKEKNKNEEKQNTKLDEQKKDITKKKETLKKTKIESEKKQKNIKGTKENNNNKINNEIKKIESHINIINKNFEEEEIEDKEIEEEEGIKEEVELEKPKKEEVIEENKNKSIPKIIKGDDFKKLNDWINNAKTLKFELIYKASKNGDKDLNFHLICDGKGPTVTVIKAKNGHIFGGYISVPFSSDGQTSSDDKAFLFSLKNMKKFPIKNKEIAIYNDPFWGPYFGDKDLAVSSECLSKLSFCKPSSYTFKRANLIGAKGNCFNVEDYEVYLVS